MTYEVVLATGTESRRDPGLKIVYVEASCSEEAKDRAWAQYDLAPVMAVPAGREQA